MTEQLDLILRTAKCPRCGYDLRGTIETWAEQCPLEGRCNECGLDVKWAEVLHPEKFEPMWCVEFARSGKLILSSCGKTFLRSFWPFRFWSLLKMSLDIHWGRIAIYLVALLLPLLLGHVCIQSAMAIRVRTFTRDQIVQWQAQFKNQIADFNASKQIMLQYYKDNYQQREDSLVDLLSRDNLDLATQDLIDETKELIEDVEEQGIDSWALQEFQSQLQLLQQYNTSVKLSHSDIVVIGEAVFLPLSDTSISGISSTSWGFRPYTPPSELRVFIRENINEYFRYDDDDQFYTTVAYVVLGILTCLLFPLTFIFLPISRKRAKVRWAHVIRVTCYSAFIPSSMICVSLIAASLGYLFKGAADSFLGISQFVYRYFILSMLIIWWAVAIKRYLRIAHGWLVAILLVAMLIMFYLFVLWQLVPSFLIDRY